METKLSFRVRVMKYAHQLKSTTGKAWSICLMKAWELYRLAKKMRNGIVKFAFEKVDGSIRIASGTLLNRPSGYTSHKRKPSFKTFAYFDVDKNEMRCFKIENLVTIY